jgi:hypothetical protein
MHQRIQVPNRSIEFDHKEPKWNKKLILPSNLIGNGENKNGHK